MNALRLLLGYPTNNNNTTTTATTTAPFSLPTCNWRSSIIQARAWAESSAGMAFLRGQSAGSRRLPCPASDSRRSLLNTRSEVRRWKETQTPPLEAPPRGVGVPRLPRACPMGGVQGVARCFLSNGKASEVKRRGRRHGRGPIRGRVRDGFEALFFHRPDPGSSALSSPLSAWLRGPLQPSSGPSCLGSAVPVR